MRTFDNLQYEADKKKDDKFTPDISHSMTGEGMNCLEFFDMIKKEWCLSEEQYKPFWNDVLTFARKYHKERRNIVANGLAMLS